MSHLWVPLPSHAVGQAGNEGPASAHTSSQNKGAPSSPGQAGSLGIFPKPGEDTRARPGLLRCPLPAKLAVSNPWHGNLCRWRRSHSAGPGAALLRLHSVPRRPNPSWHPSESSWMLRHLQDTGFAQGCLKQGPSCGFFAGCSVKCVIRKGTRVLITSQDFCFHNPA